MQAVPGVTCYCCGQQLGTNMNCGDKAASSVQLSRPPCLWAHTDASIVERCVRKGKSKSKPQDDREACENAAKESHTILPNGTPVFVPPIVGGYGIPGVVVGWTAESRRYSVQFVGSSRTTGSVPMQKALVYIDKSNMSSYPSDALPFDSSVRCVIDDKLRGVLHYAYGTDVDHVCGIIQGVAVDGSNHVVYFMTLDVTRPRSSFFLLQTSLL